MKKRIYRPVEGKVIGGVCAGLGEYFDIDPTWIRILFVLTIFAQGVGLLTYLVAWIVIPRIPEPSRPAPSPATEAGQSPGIVSPPTDASQLRGPSFLPGVILIALGLIFLFNRLFFWFDFRYVWPLVLVGIGVVLIFHSVKPRRETSHSVHIISDTTEAENERR